jgi:hypothetical protein
MVNLTSSGKMQGGQCRTTDIITPYNTFIAKTALVAACKTESQSIQATRIHILGQSDLQTTIT